MVQVLEVVAGCRSEDKDELREIVYQNSLRLFFPQEKMKI